MERRTRKTINYAESSSSQNTSDDDDVMFVSSEKLDARPATIARKRKTGSMLMQKYFEKQGTENPPAKSQAPAAANRAPLILSAVPSTSSAADEPIPSTSSATQVGTQALIHVPLLHPAHEIARHVQLEPESVFRITKLFDSGNSVPFLAKFPNLTGNCDAVKLKGMKILYEFFSRHPENMNANINWGEKLAAVDVFATNLKKLLLTPPLKGKPILAIHPGLNCYKIALIEGKAVLHVQTIDDLLEDAEEVKAVMTGYGCNTIALSKDKGYRKLVCDVLTSITNGVFPINIDYTVVNSIGVSVYSVSEEAKEEFVDTDPAIICAISIARRLQDPLEELLKIEPKHLDIGKYQPDDKELVEIALNETAVECVCLVGVDINTASISILSKIPGLNEAKATKICGWRAAFGSFSNRSLIRDVYQFDNQTFRECSSFLRIFPQTVNAERPDPAKWAIMSQHYNVNFHPFDQTQIHPELYHLAHKLCERMGVEPGDIGKPGFLNKVEEALTPVYRKVLGLLYLKDAAHVRALLEILSKPLNQRGEFDNFQGKWQAAEISPGDILRGKITSVIKLGAFVDLGDDIKGLIHKKNFKGLLPVEGQSVVTEVLSVDPIKQQISLSLLRII